MSNSPRIALALALALGSLVVAALAQGTAESNDPATLEEPAGSDNFTDLTPPDLDAPREPDVCPDRPPRPEWLENLPVRESYKGVLLTELYDARSYEAIVATSDCSCANRAPSWDAALAEYKERFAGLDYEGHSEATSELMDLKGALYRQARAICQEQGNW